MKAKIGLLLALTALAILAASCSEEDVKVSPIPKPTPGEETTLVQFAVTEASILENALSNEVVIVFDRPATESGEIELSVNSTALDQFNFEPLIANGTIRLIVNSGETSIKFTIKPVNNTILDGDKSVSFSISSVTEGFKLGERKNFAATLVDDESPARVDFMLNVGSTRENASEGATVMLVLSHPSPGESSVLVSFNSENSVYGVDYITEPAAVDGKIAVPVAAGESEVFFKVIPLNNSIINGQRQIEYSLQSVQGPLNIGDNTTHELSLNDDEMYGLPKSYTIGATNGWFIKKSYEYDAQGRIVKVVREENLRVSTQHYHYNSDGRLEKMSESDFSETFYTYDNEGRIVKSERFKDGVKKSYNIYSYDPAGNVGEVAAFYRQPSGDIILSMVFVYLYYDNGNLYKRMVYNPNQETGELVEVSVETYGGYMEKENPFPVYELVPGVSAQPWLPTNYEYQNGDTEYSYTFSYEYDAEGRMIKRNVYRNGSLAEVNGYEYY